MNISILSSSQWKPKARDYHKISLFQPHKPNACRRHCSAICEIRARKWSSVAIWKHRPGYVFALVVICTMSSKGSFTNSENEQKIRSLTVWVVYSHEKTKANGKLCIRVRFRFMWMFTMYEFGRKRWPHRIVSNFKLLRVRFHRANAIWNVYLATKTTNVKRNKFVFGQCERCLRKAPVIKNVIARYEPLFQAKSAPVVQSTWSWLNVSNV